MLHAHTTVRGPCSPYTFLECMLMIAYIVQLLIDALSRENVRNT